MSTIYIDLNKNQYFSEKSILTLDSGRDILPIKNSKELAVSGEFLDLKVNESNPAYLYVNNVYPEILPPFRVIQGICSQTLTETVQEVDNILDLLSNLSNNIGDNDSDIGDLEGDLSDLEDLLDDLNNNKLPALEDRLDDLNNIKLPHLQDQLDLLNNTKLPALQDELDDLNNNKLPNLQDQLDDLNNIDLPNLQDELDDLNNIKLPNLQDELDTLNNTRLPNLEQDLVNNSIAINDLEDNFSNLELGVEVVDTLPTNATEGDIVYLKTDKKLYRYDGTQWINDVDANDIAGQIDDTQISPNAIKTPQLFAGAVTTVKLDALAVTAAKIQSHTITAQQIASDTITANEIFSDTITANEIATDAITANEIASNTITSNEILANTITANEIGADEITSNEINVSELIASQIFADKFVANRGYVDELIAQDVFADVITSNEINVDELIASNAWVNEIIANDAYIDKIINNNLWTDRLTANEINVAELSALSANIGTVTAGLLRNSSGNFNIDLTGSLLKINDLQNTPQRRVNLGKLGSGNEDWGLEIFDSNGKAIIVADGLGTNVVGEANIIDGAITVQKVNFTFFNDNTPADEIVGAINADPQNNGLEISGNKITIDGSTTFTNSSIPTSAIDGNVSAGNVTILSDTEPTQRNNGDPLVEGDIWLDTNDDNERYFYDGTDFILGTTTIDGGKIQTGSISLNKLNFTAVKDDNVIASINTSPETGLAINGDKLTINSQTVFANNYDPSNKETPNGALSKANSAKTAARNNLAQKLGYSDYSTMYDLAQDNETLISGGYISTSLLDVNTIIANESIIVGGDNVSNLTNDENYQTNNDVNGLINTFENTLGNAAYLDDYTDALNGTTLIVGSYIKTSLIDVDAIVVNKGIIVGGDDISQLNNNKNFQTDSDVTGSINSFENTLGDGAFIDAYTEALNGVTLIQNGYIDTSLINANTIIANKNIVVGGDDISDLNNDKNFRTGSQVSSTATDAKNDAKTELTNQYSLGSLGDAAYINSYKEALDGVTLISGGYINTSLIESGSIITSKLTFTPTDSSNVIGVINNSPAGLTIDTNNLNLNANNFNFQAGDDYWKTSNNTFSFGGGILSGNDSSVSAASFDFTNQMMKRVGTTTRVAIGNNLSGQWSNNTSAIMGFYNNETRPFMGVRNSSGDRFFFNIAQGRVYGEVVKANGGFRMQMGDLADVGKPNRWGLLIKSGGQNVFQVDQTTARIAGFKFNSQNLYSVNNNNSFKGSGIFIDSQQERLSLGSSTYFKNNTFTTIGAIIKGSFEAQGDVEMGGALSYDESAGLLTLGTGSDYDPNLENGSVRVDIDGYVSLPSGGYINQDGIIQSSNKYMGFAYPASLGIDNPFAGMYMNNADLHINSFEDSTKVSDINQHIVFDNKVVHKEQSILRGNGTHKIKIRRSLVFFYPSAPSVNIGIINNIPDEQPKQGQFLRLANSANSNSFYLKDKAGVVDGNIKLNRATLEVEPDSFIDLVYNYDYWIVQYDKT